MANADEFEAALKLSGSEFKGKEIRIEKAKPMPDKSNFTPGKQRPGIYLAENITLTSIFS